MPSSPKAARVLLAIPLLCAVSACGSAPVKDPAAPEKKREGGHMFPSQNELTKIAAAPTPAKLFDDRMKDVPHWDLTGPLPDAVDAVPHEAKGPIEKMLADEAATKPDSAFTTEAMFCVARENTLFYLANESFPAEPLSRFISARCGAEVAGVGMQFHGVKGAMDKMPDDKLIAELTPSAKKMIQAEIAQGSQDLGIYWARKGGHAVVGLASARRAATVEKTPIVPGPDGKVVVRGELLRPAGSFRALINRGRYGYARCTPDLSVTLPKFAVECPALPEDEAAWLEISAFAPGRILGENVLEMLVWPSGSPKKTYAKLASLKPGEAPSVGAAQLPALVKQINDVRKEAGLGPVSLSDRQSQTAATLAPHYFAAVNGAEAGPMADNVALGLRAGWEVGGTIRFGTFVSTSVRDAADYGDVLRYALSRPVGREALLDPAVERVAIGTVSDEKEHVLGAVFSAYALFDSYKHDQDATTVMARVGALRAARGKSAPSPLNLVLTDAARAAAAVQDGKQEPREALHALLEVAASRLNRGGLQGFAIEANSLDDLQFPEALLNVPALGLAIGVAHHKRPDEAWGRFIILVVAAESATVITASAEGAHHG